MTPLPGEKEYWESRAALVLRAVQPPMVLDETGNVDMAASQRIADMLIRAALHLTDPPT